MAVRARGARKEEGQRKWWLWSERAVSKGWLENPMFNEPVLFYPQLMGLKL